MLTQKINPIALGIVSFLALCGCDSTQHIQTSGVVHRAAPESPELITRSLFGDADRTISEEDIQRLLKGRIRIPDTVRVAVFKYSSSSINRYYSNYWNDEEYLKTEQRFVDTLIYCIGQSLKVARVIPVPSLMTKVSPSITQLRESAVRLQADLLVVYALSSDIYYRWRAFKKNEAKAFATCEMIVLDTRTGVIPHSSVVTKDKFVFQVNEDMADNETRKRAERDAILLSLTESGRSVSMFLNGSSR